MPITNLTWAMTLIFIGSDILLYFFSRRLNLKNEPGMASFDDEIKAELKNLSYFSAKT